MKPMKAGRMKHRVQVQQDQGNTFDSQGAPIRNWVTVGSVWAAVEPRIAREIMNGQQMSGDITHLITIRYRADLAITPKFRILFGSRIFEIFSILNTEEAQRESVILAREQV